MKLHATIAIPRGVRLYNLPPIDAPVSRAGIAMLRAFMDDEFNRQNNGKKRVRGERRVARA